MTPAADLTKTTERPPNYQAARIAALEPHPYSPAFPGGAFCLSNARVVGAWRSLVAHLTGGQGVVGSNPAAPTIFSSAFPEKCRAVSDDKPRTALSRIRPSGFKLVTMVAFEGQFLTLLQAIVICT